VFLQTIFSAFTTLPAAALAASLKLRLYQNNIVPTPTDLTAAYTEATFSGYTMASATLVGPVTLSPAVQGVIAIADFLASGGSPYVPNTVYGYYCTAAGLLVCSEQFRNPVPFAADGAFLSLTLALPLPNFQPTS
jgi:hypothetical protein